MKKIKVTTQLLVYGLTVLSSAGMFLTIFAATSPTMPETKKPNVSDFSQLHMQMGQTVFAAASPFPDKVDLTPIPGMETGGLTQMLPPNSPVVPPMPGNARGGGHDDVLRVIGILPPDVAILQCAGRTVTAKIGTQTPWGTLSSVSKAGVTVGGDWVAFKK